MCVGWGEGGEGGEVSRGSDWGFCLVGFDVRELDMLELVGCGQCSWCFHRKESKVHERYYLCDWIIFKVCLVVSLEPST